MNYIKLNIGNKERGAKLGLGFIKYYTDNEKVSVNDFFSSFSNLQGENGTNLEFIMLIPKMLYYSLAYNCVRSGAQLDFTEDDVFDWIDAEGGVSNLEVMAFIDAFGKSLGNPDNVEEGKRTPSKAKK